MHFLALAAALLSLGSPFKAAQTLHSLLDESSPEKQLLPTIQQLKDLLISVSEKIGCSGFVDCLEGWDMILKSQQSPLHSTWLEPEDSQLNNAPLPQHVPPRTDSNDSTTINEQHETTSTSQTHQPNDVNTQSTGESIDHSSALGQTVSQGLPLNTSALPGNPESLGNSPIGFQPLPAEGTSSRQTIIGRPIFSNIILQPADEVTKVRGLNKFRPSGCPPASAISQLLRAIAEVDRMGEAKISSIVIVVPAAFASWVITLVYWCLGMEPEIRLDVQSDQINNKSAGKSKVTIEVASSNSKMFTVKTFYRLDDLEELFWENKSFVTASTPWFGMVKPKTFFESRLRELQTRHDLTNVVDALFYMAQNLSSAFHMTHVGQNEAWTSRAFPHEEDIFKLIARLYNIDSIPKKLAKLEKHASLGIWTKKTAKCTAVSELFLEILLLSAIENAHLDDNDIDIFISCDKGGATRLDKTLVQFISNFLKTGQGSQNLNILPARFQQLVLAFVAADQRCEDGSSPLISAKNGQVVYLSLLETYTMHAHCPLSYRVYPGSLRYSNQKFLYASAENLTRLGDTFSEKLADKEFSSEAVLFKPVEDPRGESQWFCSMEDNHLTMYLAPYLNSDISLNPALFVRAVQSVIVLLKCETSCSTMEDVEDKITFTESLGTALLSTYPRLIRILTCSDNPMDALFIQAALVELWSNTVEFQGIPAENVLLIAQGQSCLPCACRKALSFALAEADGKDIGDMRVILISSSDSLLH